MSLELTEVSPPKAPQFRSGEELAMRAIIVPEMRKRWPSARIVHELPLRYSSNRIDLAAITPTEIVSVEIKSSKDVSDRLEAQIRGFLPISSRVIVALAPKWNEKLPIKEEERALRGRKYTAHVQQLTECQEIIERIGYSSVETWTVDASAGSLEVTQQSYRSERPWLSRMLHMLHVAELAEIARKHRCYSAKRPVHLDLVSACTDLMTGNEVTKAVCAALRARDAFGSDSDSPILEVRP